MTYAYLRQLSGANNIANQQNAILAFAFGKGINIDKEVIEYSTTTRAIEDRDEFQSFVHGLNKGDIIIANEIWMLSEKVDEIVKIIHCILSQGIGLYITSSSTIITEKSTIGEIFPLLNSLREEQKIRENKIGRPKGSRSKSKFDLYQQEIIAYLKDGMNVSAIARKLEVSRSSLKDYIVSRGIKEMLNSSFVGVEPSTVNDEMDNKLLICPFSQKKINLNSEGEQDAR
jgi:DNA invertase Pin-like site-specific DNA recombinase